MLQGIVAAGAILPLASDRERSLRHQFFALVQITELTVWEPTCTMRPVFLPPPPSLRLCGAVGHRLFDVDILAALTASHNLLVPMVGNGCTMQSMSLSPAVPDSVEWSAD